MTGSDDETDGEAANGGTSGDATGRVESEEVRSRLDTTLASLADQRRRDVLYVLGERETSTTDALARHVAARDAGVGVEDVPAEDREQVKIDLYHNHLPVLADAGLLDHDRRSGAVRYHRPPETLERCLELCRSLELVE